MTIYKPKTINHRVRVTIVETRGNMLCTVPVGGKKRSWWNADSFAHHYEREKPTFREGDRVTRGPHTGVLKHPKHDGSFWMAFDEGGGMFTTTVQLEHEKKPSD